MSRYDPNEIDPVKVALGQRLTTEKNARLNKKVNEALTAELKRQAAEFGSWCRDDAEYSGHLSYDGPIDVGKLTDVAVKACANE